MKQLPLFPIESRIISSPMKKIKPWILGIFILAITPIALMLTAFWVMAIKLPIFAYEIWEEHRNDAR